MEKASPAYAEQLDLNWPHIRLGLYDAGLRFYLLQHANTKREVTLHLHPLSLQLLQLHGGDIVGDARGEPAIPHKGGIDGNQGACSVSARPRQQSPVALPARPNRGTSWSSLTTMLRSASRAAFEMVRTCCCDRQASKASRVTRRVHDVHCGRSADRAGPAADAIEWVTVLGVGVWKSAARQRPMRNSLRAGGGRARPAKPSPHHETTGEMTDRGPLTPGADRQWRAAMTHPYLFPSAPLP